MPERPRSYRTKAGRLADELRRRITGGLWTTGSFLPPETALAAELGAARATIRSALGQLVDEGLLQRIPFRGLVVQSGPPPVRPPVRHRRRRQDARRPCTIGVLAPTAPSEGVRLILAGITAFAAEHQQEVQLISDIADPARPLALLARLDGCGFDGVIVLPYPGDDHTADLEELYRRRFPLVCVERRHATLVVPSVEIDSQGGMHQAVRHLLERHHRPVHYLGLRSAHKADGDRFEGWRQAMIETGYGHLVASHAVLHEWDTSDPRFWHADEPWRQGYEVAQRLFAGGEQHLSVACQKDDIAWGCYRAAAERGLQIGRPLAITGFDDQPYAATLEPGLTTVRQPFREKGWRAAWLLHRQIAGHPVGPLQIRLPTELILRGSA
jgi:DNA-binding LacI/PurR family transcriptional regulator